MWHTHTRYKWPTHTNTRWIIMSMSNSALTSSLLRLPVSCSAGLKVVVVVVVDGDGGKAAHICIRIDRYAQKELSHTEKESAHRSPRSRCISHSSEQRLVTLDRGCGTCAPRPEHMRTHIICILIRFIWICGVLNKNLYVFDMWYFSFLSSNGGTRK